MKCKVCNREAQQEGYCNLHLAAYSNILGKFTVWVKVANTSWSEYLEEIQKNSLTGEATKEVAKYLLWREEK